MPVLLGCAAVSPKTQEVAQQDGGYAFESLSPGDEFTPDSLHGYDEDGFVVVSGFGSVAP